MPCLVVQAAPAAAAPPVRAVRPSEPDAELRLMGAEVRDYVDSVLENLAANIPKVRHPPPHLRGGRKSGRQGAGLGTGHPG
jgi:hypothetical protein